MRQITVGQICGSLLPASVLVFVGRKVRGLRRSENVDGYPQNKEAMVCGRTKADLISKALTLIFPHKRKNFN